MNIICPHCGEIVEIDYIGDLAVPVVDMAKFFDIEIPEDIKIYLKENLSNKTYSSLIMSKDISWLDNSIKDIFIFELEDYIIEHIKE